MLWMLSLVIAVTFGSAAGAAPAVPGAPAPPAEASVRCLVDTGASQTIITQDVAAQIPTLSRPMQATQLVAASGDVITGTLRTLPTVSTPDITWYSPLVVVVPNGALQPGTACILGMNLLGQQPLYVDWQTGRLRPISQDLLTLIRA